VGIGSDLLHPRIKGVAVRMQVVCTGNLTAPPQFFTGTGDNSIRVTIVTPRPRFSKEHISVPGG
jgi:hypothetical protein